MDLLYILLALGIIWTIIWFRIITSVPRVEPEVVVAQESARLLRRLIFPLGAALLIGLAFSFYWMPYPSVRGHTIGQPMATVNISALQWGWIISRQQIPVHTKVEFDLTSRDVNHDFAIYNPDGQLVTQAQVMPGYTNKLIYAFDKPGVYTIRCLEYCGLGHDIMVATLTIV
jgi:cytochrome c oxidase subunit 2